MAIPQVEDIQYLALNYSKSQLASLARTGQINPQDAVMAGMMQDRIQKANAQPPSTTVAEDILAPQMPQGIQGLPQQQIAQAEPMPAEMPVGMEGEAAGLEALPIPEDMYTEEGMAGGGIVAFEEGGMATAPGIDALAGINSDLAKAVREREAVRTAYLGEDTATKDFLEKTRADLEKAKKQEENSVYDAITMAGIEYARTGKLGEATAAGGKQFFEGQEASRKKQRELQKELLSAAGLSRKERAEALGAAEKAEQSRKELASREKIAAMPPDAVRGAQAIRLPGESMEDALSRYANATTTKDQYNAAAGLVQAAYKAAAERFKDSVSASGSNYQLALAAAGNQKALKELKTTQEQAKKDLATIEQGYLTKAYEGVGMDPETANRYLRAPKTKPAATSEVDRNNPLLK